MAAELNPERRGFIWTRQEISKRSTVPLKHINRPLNELKKRGLVHLLPADEAIKMREELRRNQILSTRLDRRGTEVNIVEQGIRGPPAFWALNTRPRFHAIGAALKDFVQPRPPYSFDESSNALADFVFTPYHEWLMEQDYYREPHVLCLYSWTLASLNAAVVSPAFPFLEQLFSDSRKNGWKHDGTDRFEGVFKILCSLPAAEKERLLYGNYPVLKHLFSILLKCSPSFYAQVFRRQGFRNLSFKNGGIFMTRFDDGWHSHPKIKLDKNKWSVEEGYGNLKDASLKSAILALLIKGIGRICLLRDLNEYGHVQVRLSHIVLNLGEFSNSVTSELKRWSIVLGRPSGKSSIEF